MSKVRLIKKNSLEEFRYRWEGANAREGTSISSVVMDEMIVNIKEIIKGVIGEDEPFKEPIKGDKVPYKQFVETSLKSHALARNHLRAEQRKRAELL